MEAVEAVEAVEARARFVLQAAKPSNNMALFHPQKRLLVNSMKCACSVTLWNTIQFSKAGSSDPRYATMNQEDVTLSE